MEPIEVSDKDSINRINTKVRVVKMNCKDQRTKEEIQKEST